MKQQGKEKNVTSPPPENAVPTPLGWLHGWKIRWDLISFLGQTVKFRVGFFILIRANIYLKSNEIQKFSSE